MKKWIVVGWLCLGGAQEAGAQEQEVQQLLLNVEKLAQLKSILEDLKKGYEIAFNGYSTIKNISEGNFQLHDIFLQSLLEVSPTVRNYKRIGDIVQAQLDLLGAYKKALRVFERSGLLHPDELEYVRSVYNNLLKRSLGSLDDLSIVLSSGTLRMTDAERLSIIDSVWNQMGAHQSFLRQFNNEAKVLLLQRATSRGEINSVKALYSIND